MTNPSWMTFLRSEGAVSDGDGSAHFGDPAGELHAALASDILCDLSHEGLITVTGADAESFLQGQFTNDVRQVTDERSQLCGYCTPQGRLLATFRLFRRADRFRLRLPRERLEAVLKRLRMYVMRAQVSLIDSSDEGVSLGLSGPRAPELLENALGPVPAAVDAVTHVRNITLIRLPGPWPRFELYGDMDAIGPIWTALRNHVTRAGADSWRLLNIVAGVPTVYNATAETFIPQMINWDALNGVSFRKGCYTGQEIVARTHYLGKLKRRLYRARCAGPSAPRPGDALFSIQLDAGQDAGSIVDACRHPAGGHEVLAVIVTACAEESEIRLGDAQGPLLSLLPLPYSLDDAATA